MGEIEAGRDGATDQCPVAQRLSRLPTAEWNDHLRTLT